MQDAIVVDMPRIRVARLRDKLYSVDNRRLFVLKAAKIRQVHAIEIAWSDEFDNKLAQRPRNSPDHIATTDTNVEAWGSLPECGN